MRRLGRLGRAIGRGGGRVVEAVSVSVHNLLAGSVSSLTSLSIPVIGQIHALLADDVESNSTVSQPDIGQVHVLLADNVESNSTLSQPALDGAGASGGDASLGFTLDSEAHGGTLTISTNGAESFGTRTNTKPLCIWLADDNTKAANLTLGRESWDSDTWGGTFVTDEKATNAARSMKCTIGDAEAADAGPWKHHADESDFQKIYRYAHCYKDFHPYARPCARATVDEGSTLVPGDIVTGSVGGTKGKVRYINGNRVFFDEAYDGGTGNNFGIVGANIPVNHGSDIGPADWNPYVYNEVLNAVSGNSATVADNYAAYAPTWGNSIYWGFNMKGIRVSNKNDDIGESSFVPSFYVGAHRQSGEGGSWTRQPYRFEFESPGSWWNGSSYLQTYSSSVLFGDKGEYLSWSTEEHSLLESTVNDHDGEFKFWVNGFLVSPGTNMRTRADTSKALRGVPPWNQELGIGKDSFLHYNYIYLDDEFARVYVTDADHVNTDQTSNQTINLIPLPITAWSDTSITCHYLNYYPNWTHVVIVKGDQTQLVIAKD